MTDSTPHIHCVLFDLDGTLLDTSYDFTYALNETCKAYKQPTLRYKDIRKVVSQGGLAMVKLAFPNATEAELEVRRTHFLSVYFDNIDHQTRVFPGLTPGLQHLADNNIPWGIVTNKPGWLTEKLLHKIQFPSAPLKVVSGDTLAVRKPNPAPLLLAAKACATQAEHCLYIGDHIRDIEAGKNAGMLTGAALFGFLPDDKESARNTPWDAHFYYETPHDISLFLKTIRDPCTSNVREKKISNE